VIDGTLTEEGIIFTLGRELPKVLEANIEEFAEYLLDKISKEETAGRKLKYNDLFWAVHPGGPAILNAVEKKLDLLPEKLASPRQVLMDYGNINSNTIIFVLDYMRIASAKRRELAVHGGLADPLLEDPEWGFMLAFGPGITMEGMVARNLV
jgi:predicted naringenin-chalcone synthase